MCVFCANIPDPPKIEWWPIGYDAGLELGDGLTTKYNEKLGAQEANPGIVFYEKNLNGSLYGVKAAWSVGLFSIDLGLQIGFRKGWWPRYFVWAYRGSTWSALLAVIAWNAFNGLRH